MPVNKIVIHDKSGNILKGTTADFLPKRPLFHLAIGGIHGEEMKKILVDNLKAIFFVKDFNGDKDYIIKLIHGSNKKEDDLIEFLKTEGVDKGKITNWMLPKLVAIVDEVPKTSVGKYNKREIKKNLEKYLAIAKDMKK